MWFISHKNVYFDELRFFFFVFSLLSFIFLNFSLEFRKHLLYSSYVTKNQIIWLKIKRVISKTRISAQTFEKYYNINSSYCLLSEIIYLFSLGPNLNPQGISNRMLKFLTRYDTFMLDSNSKSLKIYLQNCRRKTVTLVTVLF